MDTTALLITLQNSTLAVSLRGAPSILQLLDLTNMVVCFGLAALLVVALWRAPRTAASVRFGLGVLASAGLICGSLMFVAEPFKYSLGHGGLEAVLVLAALFITPRRQRSQVRAS